jgi:hypothetical protein
MPRIIIPEGAAYTLGCVRIPLETPVGIMDGSAWQLTYDGRRYQSLAPPLFMDMDTGEEVELVLEGW